MAARFLRHEGYLGAVGAFLLVHPGMSRLSAGTPGGAGSGAATSPAAAPSKVSAAALTTCAATFGGVGQPEGSMCTFRGTGAYAACTCLCPRCWHSLQVRARFVERFSMGAPITGGQVVGPAIGDLQGKVSWVEKFVALGDLRRTASVTAGDEPVGAGSGVGSGAQTPQPQLQLQQQQQQQQPSAEGGSEEREGVEGVPSGGTGELVAAGAGAGAGGGGGGGGGQKPRRVVSLPPTGLPTSLIQQQDSQQQSGHVGMSGPGQLRTASVVGGGWGRGGGICAGGAGSATTASFISSDLPASSATRMALHVGVLHYSPSFDVFPLLADPTR
jgi:type II pantothenate kinase